ncbi:hypothetical protein SAMN06269250_2800 [Spirosoma fluviale]|uniref:Uncharacterized protein n=1 Tax=Spirosoma fluviale TaxID=1597977 RepID=A0A286G151_9BACT|nr:hypothetical protein SAMN06269250_2800 [Spirosoma fluviale]
MAAPSAQAALPDNKHVPFAITTTQLGKKPHDGLTSKGMVLPRYINLAVRSNGGNQAQVSTPRLLNEYWCLSTRRPSVG